MFGVTTPCVQQLTKQLADHYDCLVFHAPGSGGKPMEKLVDSQLVDCVINITTTEVCDYLFGGILACNEDRFGAIMRTQIPCIISCGALDMVWLTLVVHQPSLINIKIAFFIIITVKLH